MVREALASRPSTDVGGRASLCVFFATASFAAAAAPSRKVSDRDEASAAVARVPARATGPRSAADVAVGHLCGALSGPIGFGSKLCRSALRRVARRMRANSCTVGPRPRPRQFLRRWRRTGGYIWVRAQGTAAVPRPAALTRCFRHRGGRTASALHHGLVTARIELRERATSLLLEQRC